MDIFTGYSYCEVDQWAMLQMEMHSRIPPERRFQPLTDIGGRLVFVGIKRKTPFGLKKKNSPHATLASPLLSLLSYARAPFYMDLFVYVVFRSPLYKPSFTIRGIPSGDGSLKGKGVAIANFSAPKV